MNFRDKSTPSDNILTECLKDFSIYYYFSWKNQKHSEDSSSRRCDENNLRYANKKGVELYRKLEGSFC